MFNSKTNSIMEDILIIRMYPKGESTMPFDALEAFVRTDAPVSGKVAGWLESAGFDFMDESVSLDGMEGRWDYYGKILPE